VEEYFGDDHHQPEESRDRGVGEGHRSNGSTGTYTVVDSADIALIVPVGGDRLHLVEQYRHPVGGRRWEFPQEASTSGWTQTHKR
jgi:hypothetical protein